MGLFSQPTDIAFNSKGEIYIADGDSGIYNHILKFSSDLKLLQTIGTKGNRTSSIQHLPISSSKVNSFSLILCWSIIWIDYGTFVSFFFILLSGLQIEETNEFKSFIQTARSSVSGPVQEHLLVSFSSTFVDLGGIFLDQRLGRFFVSDGDANVIHRLKANMSTSDVWNIGTCSIIETFGQGQLRVPHLISSDPVGNVYVAEIQGLRVSKFVYQNR